MVLKQQTKTTYHTGMRRQRAAWRMCHTSTQSQEAAHALRHCGRTKDSLRELNMLSLCAWMGVRQTLLACAGAGSMCVYITAD